MDCLPTEGRHFQFAAIKLSPSYPPAWDFLGVREICAECWRREFQGKFTFVSSPHKKTFSSRLHRRNRLKCCWQVNPQKGTKSIWMPGQLGRLRQCKSARVIVIGEICNFLASNSWQLPFDSHNSKFCKMFTRPTFVSHISALLSKIRTKKLNFLPTCWSNFEDILQDESVLKSILAIAKLFLRTLNVWC